MNDYTLAHGSHTNPEDGRCAMEWVAFIAGEPHTDQPACVDVALRRFGVGLNDNLPDDLRQQLRPYLARMIGTADDGRTQERLYLLADWAIRHAAAAAQDAVGRTDLGDRLRAIPSIVDKSSAKSAEEVAREVHADAYAAAYAAADAAAAAAAAYAYADAAYAAYAAAAAAAYAAAAYAAYAAAAAAAYAAAAYAAYAAAAAAAYAADAKRQMWVRLLPSALDLLDRMLPGEVIELSAPVAERAVEVLSA
jgi:hypothetical protein